MNRSRFRATILASLSILTVGIVANVLTSLEGIGSERLINYVSLVVSLLLAAVFSVRSMSGHAMAARDDAEKADANAERAGEDADRIYEELISNKEVPPEVKFIYQWARLEKKMRSTVQSSSGDDFMGLPLGSLIGSYADALGLTTADKNRLQGLLRMRNALVHSYGTVGIKELEAGLNNIVNYIEMTPGERHEGT